LSCVPFLFQQKVGITIIPIATGKGIGATNRALIMTVYMNQGNYITAKKALLHGLKIKPSFQKAGLQFSTIVNILYR
jgi:hypothetical protein